LVDAKNGKFWIAKLDTRGKILIEKTFYKVGQGFDIVKNRVFGFIAVGYKYFDFLGNFINRGVLILLDKNLNFLTDRTYGDTDNIIKWIFNFKDNFLAITIFKNISIIMKIDYKAFMTWHQGAGFLTEDAKVVDNKLYYSTALGIFMFDKNITKYKDYRNAGIIDKDKFYLDNFLIIGNFEKEFKDLDIFSASFDEKNNLFYIVGEKNNDYVLCKYVY